MSRLADGSSEISSRGRSTSTAAIEHIRFSPPDRWCGARGPREATPVSAIASATRALTSSGARNRVDAEAHAPEDPGTRVTNAALAASTALAGRSVLRRFLLFRDRSAVLSSIELATVTFGDFEWDAEKAAANAGSPVRRALRTGAKAADHQRAACHSSRTRSL